MTYSSLENEFLFSKLLTYDCCFAIHNNTMYRKKFYIAENHLKVRIDKKKPYQMQNGSHFFLHYS